MCLGQNKAEGCKRTQDFQRRQGLVAFKRSARNRGEQVQRHGIDAQLLQGEGHFYALFGRFVKAEDTTTAHAQARCLSIFNGGEFILIGMRSADIGEMATTGFQIGMEAGYASCFQSLGLFQGQDAQGSAHFNFELLLNAAQSLANIVKVIGLTLATTAGYDGKAHCASLFSLFSSLKELLLAQQAVFLNTGVPMCGLSAELAVFAAFAAAAVDNSTAVHLVTGKFLANLVGHSAQHHGIVIAHVNQIFSFFSSNILTSKYLVGQSNNFFHSEIHIPIFSS